ncbi:MAG: S41 family peptidase [Gemmatimonadota bacterium]|jgi:carboxyl-terminal processing protease|nr:hypothetical protein [Gemmatimonadota bacterium]MDP6530208.1 S41 family peptidase [Gemmatimonadota bacterium]MDP7030849.1 S41 family peptidase [Gemmatimonadota bacterium]
MIRRRHVFRVIVPLLVVAAVVAVTTRTQAARNIFNDIKVYNKVLVAVFDQYVDEVDSGDLIRASIEGMLGSLDQHTNFMEKKQFDRLMLETQGKYGGIGISIDIRDDWLTVVSPIEGTPAFKLGIRAGDQIVAIEEESTHGITTAEAASILRGPKGTEVTITIRRKGEPAPFEVTIVRDVIELNSVPDARIVRDDIGYLRLSRFSEDTGEEVEAALRDLLDQGARGIVFDLRWNHGGLLTQAVSVSEMFLPKGELIAYTQGRSERDRREFRSSSNTVFPDGIPVVILVNGSTASASEIVAGALQDSDRAVILGEPTYGKGLVQTLLPMSPEANLKLTTARWYTPSGRCLQRDTTGLINGKDPLGAEAVPEEPSEDAEEDEDADEDAGDDGGIVPDIEMEGDYRTRFGFELEQQNHIFHFAVDFIAREKEIPTDFRVGESLVKEFRAFLETQDLEYETAAEMELTRLRDLLEKEEYDAETLSALEGLGARFELEKGRDFDRNAEYVAFALEREILSKVHGTAGMYSAILRNDTQAQAAVDLILDTEAFARALAGVETQQREIATDEG